VATSSNKKTASGRNATKAGKTPNPRRRQVPEPVPEQEDFIGAEIKVLLSFALAVLLFLSNFHLCGAVGGYLRGLQLGIFGMVGFIAPLLLFVGIPLPGTGAWTGTLAASILDMDFKSSVMAVMLGVLLAGIIMGIASMGVFGALGAVFS